MNNRKLPIKKVVWSVLLGLVGICGIFLLYFCYPAGHWYFPACPTYTFFHFYCPGCGSTRAVYCLIHGNLRGAFANNCILLPTAVVAGALFLFPSLRKHWLLINLYVALLILYGILRNIPYYPFTLLVPAGI